MYIYDRIYTSSVYLIYLKIVVCLLTLLLIIIIFGQHKHLSYAHEEIDWPSKLWRLMCKMLRSVK